MADDLFDGAFDAQVFSDAQKLLTIAEKLFERPIDALLAAILSVAVMARGVEMDLPDLLEGVSAAYNDIEPANPEAMQ